MGTIKKCQDIRILQVMHPKRLVGVMHLYKEVANRN
jgi:hypothetical protein